jgi:hypothetical protein
MFKERGFVGPLPLTFHDRMRDLLKLLNRFDKAPPFTIQRLVELILDGQNQYCTTHKYMNGLEKLLSVTSTLSSVI